MIIKNNKSHLLLMSIDELEQQESEQSHVSNDEIKELIKCFAARYHQALSKLAK